MSIISFVLTDIERACIRTHDKEYEATPLEGRYDFIKERINSLTPFDLLEYQVKYEQFKAQATPVTIEAWTAILQLTAAISRCSDPKDPSTKGLLRAFRDLLNSLILE